MPEDQLTQETAAEPTREIPAPAQGSQSDRPQRTRRFGRTGEQRLSPEQVVIQAVKSYNSEIREVRVYNKINKYAGGILYLVYIVFNNNSENFWSVLMRANEVQVFYDEEMAFREAVLWERKVTGLTFGGIITGVISIAIVICFLAMLFSKGGDGSAPLNYALSSVLGFWFGKSVTGSGIERADRLSV